MDANEKNARVLILMIDDWAKKNMGIRWVFMDNRMRLIYDIIGKVRRQ